MSSIKNIAVVPSPSAAEQDAAIAANAADVAALEATQAAQAALLDLNATKAEVALIQADNDAQDFYTSFVRQADNSINWTKESGATGTIAASTVAGPDASVFADFLPAAPKEATPLSHTPSVLNQWYDSKSEWVEVTSQNVQIEWGKRYIVTDAAASLIQPAGIPAADTPNWYVVRNSTNILGGSDILITGDFSVPVTGEIVTNLRVLPGSTNDFVYAGGAHQLDVDRSWSAAYNLENFARGDILYQGHNYLVTNGTANEETVRIQPRSFGYINITVGRINAGNIRVEQNDMTAPDQFLFENGTVNNHFVIPGHRRGGVTTLQSDNQGYFEVRRSWLEESTSTNILNYISVGFRSIGTNASSAVTGIVFNDIDGNPYPANAWVYSGDLTAWTGGAATITHDKTSFNGSISLGSNREGMLNFEYVGDTPNGIGSITGNPSNGGAFNGGVRVQFAGTNEGVDFTSVGAISATPWITATATSVTVTDQAAEFVPNQAYAVGDVFSWPEQSPADDDLGQWFNWRVITAIAENEFDAFDDSNVAAVEAKLERFGIQQVETGNYFRIRETGAGLLDFNIMSILDNTNHDTMVLSAVQGDDEDQTDVRLNLPFNADSFITVWQDFTGLGLTKPVGTNQEFRLPAGNKIRATREGNAIKVILESMAGGGASGDLTVADDVVAGSPITLNTEKDTIINRPITGGAIELLNVIPFDLSLSNSAIDLGVDLSTAGGVDHMIFVVTHDGGSNNGDGTASPRLERETLDVSNQARLDTFGGAYLRLDVTDLVAGQFTLSDSGSNMKLRAIKLYGAG